MKFVCSLVIGLVLIFNNPIISAFAQTLDTTRTPKLPPNLKKYFSGKYANIRDIASTLQETSEGPRGYLHLNGRIRPNSIDMNTLTSKEDRGPQARIISRAFIDEESAVLGLRNLDEIEEERVFYDEGFDGPFTYIRYLRRIYGLLLNNAYINFIIGPSKEIEEVSAELIPVSAELYTAAQKPSLSEEDIKKIIYNTLSSQGKSPENIRIERINKYLEPTSPFVYFGVTAKVLDKMGARMSYKLNAFTGEIIGSKVIRLPIKH
jgi:hypothetical protein